MNVYSLRLGPYWLDFDRPLDSGEVIIRIKHKGEHLAELLATPDQMETLGLHLLNMPDRETLIERVAQNAAEFIRSVLK